VDILRSGFDNDDREATFRLEMMVGAQRFNDLDVPAGGTMASTGTAMADSALVIIGHGSTVNADSSSVVRHLEALFLKQGRFTMVRAGFLKEEPSVLAAMEGITAKQVFIVPFFISEGYFSEEVIPLELKFRAEGQQEFNRVRISGGQTFYYCKPVGTSDRMTDVILSRAQGIVAEHPFPRPPQEESITLFVAGHGTPRNRESRRSIEHQVKLIAEARSFDAVHAAFMEEEPRIADCWGLAATRNIVMVPFFLSDGLHVREDIPVLLGESAERVERQLKAGQPTWRNPTERHGKRLWYSGAVGTDPVVAEVVMDRVREAAGWRVGHAGCDP
jgi:sirohydrochlorin cobaltochelatase